MNMKKAIEVATLGGGCFWCVEAALVQLAGVESMVSGYAGGPLPNPDYRSVCAGNTGHAEVVEVRFDPALIGYRTLLDAFFAIHDPTTLNRQGNDIGTQYRSVIYYQSPQQQATARQVIAEMANVWDAPIVTELQPAQPYYKAEDYHQDYFRQHPLQGYCAFVVAPKVSKFKKAYAARRKG